MDSTFIDQLVVKNQDIEGYMDIGMILKKKQKQKDALINKNNKSLTQNIDQNNQKLTIILKMEEEKKHNNIINNNKSSTPSHHQNHRKQQQQSHSQTQQQNQDEFYNFPANSFLVADIHQSSSKSKDIFNNTQFYNSMQSNNNNKDHKRSTSSNFFMQTSQSFKSNIHSRNKNQSMANNTLSNFMKNNSNNNDFFLPQTSNNTPKNNNLSERYPNKTTTINNNKNNQMITGSDIFSPQIPTNHGGFKPFRDIITKQHKSVIDLFNDATMNQSKRIKQQLLHNNTQMNLINDQIDYDRINSFENVYNRQQFKDHLLKNSGSAKKVQIHRTDLFNKSAFKDMINQNESNNNINNGYPNLQMTRYKSQGSPSSSLQTAAQQAMNQNSAADLEDGNNDQQQSLNNNQDELYFHWEKVVNYTSELKPEFREGATLVEYKQSFFLYGGFGFELMNSLYQFRLRDYKWHKVETNNDYIPTLGRFGHTANIYKDEMIIFGGGGDYNQKMKNRLVLNELWSLNLESMKWKQMRTTGDYIEPRRYHAACVVGNLYYVHGGIGSKENYISNLNVLQLDKGRWRAFNLKMDESGVAYHQMVPVFKKYLKLCPKSQLKLASLFQKKLKFKIKEEGIYCFGGKQGNEKIRGRLMILKCDQKDMPLEWVVGDTIGQNPGNRFQHSFFYNWQIKGCVLYGGRTDESNITECVFQDIWVLYLSNLMWVSVKVSGVQNRYRFSHAFTTIDERMFVFGGASNISYTDCELYVLEMDKLHAMKKRGNGQRDMVTRQLSLDRLDDEEGESQYQDRIKVNTQKRNSGQRTFLRPLTKDQLKSQQEDLIIPNFERNNTVKLGTYYSNDSSPRNSIMSPKFIRESIIRSKQQSLFSQYVNQ